MHANIINAVMMRAIAEAPTHVDLSPVSVIGQLDQSQSCAFRADSMYPEHALRKCRSDIDRGGIARGSIVGGVDDRGEFDHKKRIDRCG